MYLDMKNQVQIEKTIVLYRMEQSDHSAIYT